MFPLTDGSMKLLLQTGTIDGNMPSSVAITENEYTKMLAITNL